MTEALLNYPQSFFGGHNNQNVTQDIEIEGRPFLIPSNCEYHSVDISQMVETIGKRKFKVCSVFSLIVDFIYLGGLSRVLLNLSQ